MMVEFTPISTVKPGTIARLLRQSYAILMESDPMWVPETANWDAYDRYVFDYPETIGASLFLTRLGGRIAGFAAWDPREGPACGKIGHNCVLPKFRRNGLGKLQIMEVLRRFQTMEICAASVSTCDLPFFLPAQRMYTACGFCQVSRRPWETNPDISVIEYEKSLTM